MPTDLNALLEQERYEEAFGLHLRPTSADIRRAHTRLLVENRSQPMVATALNRAEAVLTHESSSDAAGRLFGIGRTMSQDSDEEGALPYLRAAVEIQKTALHCHWLGATLVALGRSGEGLPFLELAVSERGSKDDRVWLERARSELEAQVCWFCGEHPPDKAASVPVPVHLVTSKTPIYSGGRPGTHCEWRESTVAVPRCSTCQAAHGRSGLDKPALLGAFIGLAVGALGLFVSAAAGGVAIVVGLIAGVFIGRAIGRRREQPFRGKPLSHTNMFPAVRRLVDSGWQFGKKPPGI